MTQSKGVLTQLRNRRGFTLVELMIVVAIIGVLASLAIVAFNNVVVRSKMGKLESYAMAAATGQISYYNAYGHYYPNGAIASQKITGAQDSTTPGTPAFNWKRALNFSKALPEDVEGVMYSGANKEACSGPGYVCNFAVTDEGPWFVVEFSQDMNVGGSASTVLVRPDGDDFVSVMLFEGE